MKETIFLLVGGLVAGVVIMYMKDFLFKRLKKEVIKIIPEEEKKQLLEFYNKGLVTLNSLKQVGITPEVSQTTGETFNGKKLVSGVLNIKNKVLWAKDFSSIFNLRKLIIVGVIIGLIFGFGWYKGRMGAPVQINLDYDKEWVMKINGEEIYKPKNSNDVFIRDSKTHQILKQIKAKDMGLLREKLKPYGLIFEPVLVAGVGVSNASSGFEGGVGVRYLKFFKWVGDICLTNKGFYPIGVSYRISENSALGLSVGTGYKKLERGFFERFLLKFTVKF